MIVIETKRSKKKFKSWFLIFILFLFIFPLSGCWDSDAPERMLYVQGLGIDYKEGKYKIYIQLMNLSFLAKSESSTGTGKQIMFEIGQAKGISVEDALYNLYKTAQRRIHWGHLNYIFLTEDAIKHNGLQEVADLIDRYYETHYRMWIYHTESPLAEIMDVDPPINLSNYLTRFSDPNAAFEQFSYVQSVDLRQMIISHYEPPHEIIIPIVWTNKREWMEDGNKPRKIGTIKGISIIDDNKFKGSISEKDADGYRWIEKQFKRAALSLRTKDNNTVGVTIRKRKVKIEPVIKEGEVQFDIHIKTNAVISKLKNNIPTSQISGLVENRIKEEVKKTYFKGLEIDADVYRFSNVLYKKNHSAWKKHQRGGKIPLSKASIRKINVEVMINDGGKQRKIPTLK
jgi:spore germination protein KC